MGGGGGGGVRKKVVWRLYFTTHDKEVHVWNQGDEAEMGEWSDYICERRCRRQKTLWAGPTFDVTHPTKTDVSYSKSSKMFLFGLCNDLPHEV